MRCVQLAPEITLRERGGKLAECVAEVKAKARPDRPTRDALPVSQFLRAGGQ